MSKKLRFISFVLVILMLMLALASCNDDAPEETETPTESGTDATEATGEPTEKATNASKKTTIDLFADGKYAVKIVLPRNATKTEEAVAAKLLDVLEARTGVKPQTVTDETKLSANDYAILVGRTWYAESDNVYGPLNYGEAEMCVKNKNRLVIAFTTEEAGKTMIDKLDTKLASQADKFSLAFSYKEELYLKEEGFSIPEYSGGTQTTYDVGDDTSMLYVASTNRTAFDTYLSSLESDGFEKYGDTREIENYKFATYIKGKYYIYAYHSTQWSSARIVSGYTSTLAPLESENAVDDRYEPTMTLVGQVKNTNCGAGVIYLLPDGRLLIQDGGDAYNASQVGKYGEDKTDYLYKAMREIAPDPDNIRVAAWFISHPHEDHVYGFTDFLKKRHKDVSIESIVYNAAPLEVYEEIEAASTAAADFYEAIDRYIPDVKRIKAHTGQVLNYGSFKVEILLTYEDMAPTNNGIGGLGGYINSSSLVIRVDDGDKTAILLADTTHHSGKQLEDMWGNYLKSDMVQIAHHGLWASNTSLYHKIKATILLFNQNASVTNDYASDSGHSSQINAALSYATDVYFANDTGVTIKLPLEPTNNKATVLATVLSNWA